MRFDTRHATCVFTAVLAITVLAPYPLSAQATPDSVVVGVLTNWPPQYTIGEGNRPAGFAVEVFEAIAERADLRYSYRSYASWPALTEALRKAEVDLVPLYGILPERRHVARFTGPLTTFPVVLFVRDEQASVRGLDDLSGKRIAVVRTNVGESIVAERQDLDAVALSSLDEAIFELLSGQVDGLIYPRDPVEAKLRRAGIVDNVRIAGPTLAEIKRGIAIRPALGPLRDRLDPFVRQYVDTPEYRRSYERWYGRQETFWTSRRLAWTVGGILIAILLGAAIGRYASLIRLNRRLKEAVESRDEALASLEREQDLLRTVTTNLEEGLIITDTGGVVVYANPRMAEMLGYDIDELLGMSAEDLVSNPTVIGERLAERLEGRRDRYEEALLKKDGSRIWTVVSASPLRDVSGGIEGSVAAVTDITEERRIEERLREQEEQLRHTEKMESVGRLAGGIAHDFNNMLTAILGHAELALDSLPEDHPQRSDLEEIRGAARHSAELTRQLLTLGRKQVFETRLVDLNALLEETGRILRPTLEPSIRFEPHPGPGLDTIVADPIGIRQVITNLVINAGDAIESSGTVRVTTGNLGRLVEEPATGQLRPEGRYVLLEVRDTGSGIPEQDLPHIFEPFFTTKEMGRGTGLGLATVYGVVNQAGGIVEVDSRPGRGSTFRIFMPVDEGGRPTREREVGPPPLDPRVLVVDDEGALSQLMGQILERVGYRVRVWSDPGEALEAIVEGRADPPDLLVTDVSMPGMSGLELARAMRERDPDLPVLFVSGYVDTEEVAEALDDRTRFLQKPVTPDDLIDAANQLLWREWTETDGSR